MTGNPLDDLAHLNYPDAASHPNKELKKPDDKEENEDDGTVRSEVMTPSDGL